MNEALPVRIREGFRRVAVLVAAVVFLVEARQTVKDGIINRTTSGWGTREAILYWLAMLAVDALIAGLAWLAIRFIGWTVAGFIEGPRKRDVM